MSVFPTNHVFQRLFAGPLDPTTMHQTLAEAKEYALNNLTSFSGQVLSVMDARTDEEIAEGLEAYCNIFYIDGNKELKTFANNEEILEVLELRLNGLSFKKMTKAEYEALTDDEKNDESMHYIISDEIDLDLLATKEEVQQQIDEKVQDLATYVDETKALKDHTHEELATLQEQLTQLETTTAEKDAELEANKAEKDHTHVIDDVDELATKLDTLLAMFDGKAFKYLTQLEYDLLPASDKERDDIVYCITDKVDLSHKHNNFEILELINQSWFETRGTSNFDGSYLSLTNVPTEFTPIYHSHEMVDVNGLDTALLAKAELNHEHTLSMLEGYDEITAMINDKAESGHTHDMPEHTHKLNDVDDLSEQLALKADAGHIHQTSEIAGLDQALANLGAGGNAGVGGDVIPVHNHVMADVTGLANMLQNKSDITHTHQYYNITGLDDKLTEIETKLEEVVDDVADSDHTHPISKIENLETTLSNKADKIHTHEPAEINGLSTSLATLDNQITVITRELATVDQRIANAKAECASLVHTHEQADVNELEQDIEALVTDTETMKQQIQALVEQVANHEHNQDEVINLPDTIYDLDMNVAENRTNIELIMEQLVGIDELLDEILGN